MIKAPSGVWVDTGPNAFCSHCGDDLCDNGNRGYETVNDIFCSVACAAEHQEAKENEH